MFRFLLHPLLSLTNSVSALVLRFIEYIGALKFCSGNYYGATAASRQPQRLTKLSYRQGSSSKNQNPLGKKTNWKVLSRVIWFGLALVLSSLIGFALPSQSYINPNKSALAIRLPLSTQGSKIVDTTGQTVLLTGVNWFGIETEMHVPHGLWKRDYKEMLAQIKSLGYNLIRLPYSVQTLRASNISGVDFSIGSNRELEDKSPLEVMDAIIKEADRQGLLILLDSHRLNDQRISELWYGDGFTETDWIETWKMLANRYKNQANVIGADLKNEPYGRASWGTDDPNTDWRLAAERAGNIILAINPNWLIVVEGVEKNVPGQKLSTHWRGGNLEGVRRYPVRLSRPNKLVYSPHEYGPGVFNHPWFSEPSFPENLYDRWEIGWNYIAREGIAPILIGEFGGRRTDRNSKEGIWKRQLVDYINQQDLSFAYWSWNPNSDDTGGILKDNWSSINGSKQRLLQGLLQPVSFAHNLANTPVTVPTPKPQLIPEPVVRNPITKPQVNPRVSPGVSQVAQSQLEVTSKMYSNWQTGFCISMQVTNQSNTSVGDWQLSFRMNQAAINNTWNGNFRPQGSQYVVTPMDWGRIIEPGQSRELGFCANKLGSDYQPQQVSVFVR
ncbi:MAG: cellulase family glycosylhydrolase [Symploca sp. SIO1C4]|uniref:Endoglucanase n=1 Tax=Symploca sp. SIO1C4 TaxID=2607765 RepID=A0A6B3N0W2_9CYAN|nr:cellulase family glycosylhydrolase [Symploca sp. SIO1C4]